MKLSMAAANTHQYEITGSSPRENYGRPLVIIAVLFFTLGFLICLNDILIPHLRSIFNLSYLVVILVQSAFYWIPVFSIPAARFVDHAGYQKTMVTGLLTMALGAFLFVPSASLHSGLLFFAGLIFLGIGITILQVATNPYTAILGSPSTASSRLSLVHAFKGLGIAIAPQFGSMLVLSATPVSQIELNNLSQEALRYYRLAQAASVRLPYMLMGITLLALSAIFGSSRLPDFAFSHRRLSRGGDNSLWKRPNFLFGTLAIFACVGAEVSIGSILLDYFSHLNVGRPMGLSIAQLPSLYWLAAVAGGLLGWVILQKIPTRHVLGLCATGAVILVLTSILTSGHIAMWAMIAVGLCNSIMFPSVFALGISDLGPFTSDGSGLLMTATVGGAITPLAQMLLVHRTSLQSSFLLPVFCYAVVLLFAVTSKSKRLKYEEGLSELTPRDASREGSYQT
jgi:MFS transporter, FHS family, L-fucose permease